MGYTTTFKGILRPIEPFTEKQGEQLDALFDYGGPDVEFEGNRLYNFDFQIADGGLEWNGAEKSYDMVEKVNYITHLLRQDQPSFTLTGYLEAYGEDGGDIWILAMVDGRAVRKEAKLVPVD